MFQALKGKPYNIKCFEWPLLFWNCEIKKTIRRLESLDVSQTLQTVFSSLKKEKKTLLCRLKGACVFERRILYLSYCQFIKLFTVPLTFFSFSICFWRTTVLSMARTSTVSSFSRRYLFTPTITSEPETFRRMTEDKWQTQRK